MHYETYEEHYQDYQQVREIQISITQGALQILL